MPTVAVKPELLHWAINRSGSSSDELLTRFPKLEEWKSGGRQPTLRQLEDFARVTMSPFGALFLDSPPREELPIPDFRTRDGRPLNTFSPNLLDTIHSVQQRQDWLREWLAEEGAEPLDFVGKATITDNDKSLAQHIRQRLDLDADWAESLASWEHALQTLRKAMERIGIVVFSNSVVGLNNNRGLDPNEFRGFVLCDPVVPVVFVNDADTKSARMFTLAHELVHVWLGRDSVYNLDKLMPASEETERYCNHVAAEFLVPAYKFKERWTEALATDQPFLLLARRFKVSPLVAARRALDLDLITRPQFFGFYEQDKENWLRNKAELKSNSSGGNFYATQVTRLGRKFSAAIVRAVREGRILYQDAFRLTGMKGDTFQSYADQVLQQAKDERE